MKRNALELLILSLITISAVTVFWYLLDLLFRII
jgi:hypothetical protein